jgi:hypothetical protein
MTGRREVVKLGLHRRDPPELHVKCVLNGFEGGFYIG